MLTRIQRMYRKYAQDLTITKCIANDKNEKPMFNKIQVRKHFINAIRNYCSLRLAILQNKELEKVEHEIIKAGVKAGVAYATRKYNVDINLTDLNKAVDEYLPDILEAVHQDRTNLFTMIIEYCNSKD